MTTYAYPAVTPNRSVLTYDGNTKISRSWLTGFVTTRSFGGERVSITLYHDNLTLAQRALLTAFFAKLNGQQHRALIPAYGFSNQGAFGGTPLVAGASQQGNSLDIDGCSNNITDWAKAGDWFSVGEELKMFTDDVDSNGSGLATLTFRPRLRTAPADNDPIETTNPTGRFVLDESSIQWSHRVGGYSDLQVTFVEDI